MSESGIGAGLAALWFPLWFNGNLRMECLSVTTTSCFQIFLPWDSFWEKLKRLLPSHCNSVLALHTCLGIKKAVTKVHSDWKSKALAIYPSVLKAVWQDEFGKTDELNAYIVYNISRHPFRRNSLSLLSLTIYNHGKPQSVF